MSFLDQLKEGLGYKCGFRYKHGITDLSKLSDENDASEID